MSLHNTLNIVNESLASNTDFENEITNTNNSSMKPIQLNLLDLISDTIQDWKVHKCQIIDGMISQHQPMKFIYHYEHLSDVLKLQHPLTGQLLASFDRLMTREEFAQLLGIHLHQVAKPWQIKFVGKLVVFYQNPEIALRLHWVNTIKSFEPIYSSTKITESESLQTAIENAFNNWQITEVELIQKNPQIQLIYSVDYDENIHTILPSAQFVTLPKTLSNMLINYLQSHTEIANIWLEMIKSEASIYIEKNDV